MIDDTVSTKPTPTDAGASNAQSARQLRDDYYRSLEPGLQVTGVVSEVQPRYAKVKLDHGVQLLLHVSQVTGEDKCERDQRMHSLSVGDEIKALIINGQDRDNNPRLALSEKALLKQNFLDSVQVGSTFQGKIVHRADYGLFLDIGHGVQGLLHCSEVPGNTREQRDAYVRRLEVGESIDVRLIKAEQKDGRRLLSFSVVSVLRDQRITGMPGTVVKATVVRSEDGQYLIDLGYGVTANLSMDEVSGQLHSGDHVRVRVNSVLSVDNGTVSVSRDGLKAKPRARVRTVLSVQEKQEKQSKKDKKAARKGRQ